MCDWALFVSCKKLCLFLLVICSQLSFSRILVLCADGGTSSSQPVSSYASLISPLSQTLLPFSFVALQWPSHLPPLTLFYCSFLFFFLIFFFSVLLHLPWLFHAPQQLHVFVIVCQLQDIHWGWPTCVFAAAVWIQKGRFGYRSCCLLATLYAWVISSIDPLREPRENGKGILKRSVLYP